MSGDGAVATKGKTRAKPQREGSLFAWGTSKSQSVQSTAGDFKLCEVRRISASFPTEEFQVAEELERGQIRNIG